MTGTVTGTGTGGGAGCASSVGKDAQHQTWHKRGSMAITSVDMGRAHARTEMANWTSDVGCCRLDVDMLSLTRYT